LPRTQRLTQEKDLEAVRLQGKRIRTPHLEVRHVASLLRHARVGVIVPRFGHSAVERNLLKRRLREIVRTGVLPSLTAMDVVVRAFPAAYRASFQQLADDCVRARAALGEVLTR
jgi:ribonuclease P protein component